MLRIIICLIGLVLLIASCSATGLVDCQGNFVYNPDDFTSEEQEWIEESATRWNDWVGYDLISVAPGVRESCYIYAGPTKSPTAVGEAREPTKVLTIDKAHLLRIDQLNKVKFESVTMHEIGHAIGFHHLGIKSGDALMSPQSGNDFTDIDRIECIKMDICKTLE